MSTSVQQDKLLDLKAKARTLVDAHIPGHNDHATSRDLRGLLDDAFHRGALHVLQKLSRELDVATAEVHRQLD